MMVRNVPEIAMPWFLVQGYEIIDAVVDYSTQPPIHYFTLEREELCENATDADWWRGDDESWRGDDTTNDADWWK